MMDCMRRQNMAPYGASYFIFFPADFREASHYMEKNGQFCTVCF